MGNSKTKKSKKKLLIFLGLGTLSIVLAAGLFYYFWFYSLNSKDKLWDNLKAKAQIEPGYYLGVNDTPRLIAGDFTGYENKQDAESIAWTFIKENKSLYQIKNPEKELEVSEKTETPNTINIEFVQRHKGIPVYGAYVVVRVSLDLKIESVFSTYVPNIDIKTESEISKENAVKNSEIEGDTESFLVIYSPNVYNNEGDAELAWYVKGEEESLFINAETGDLIDGYSNIRYALDRETYTAGFQKDSTGILWINENGQVLGLPAGEPDQAGINVHNNAGNTYNYYHSRLGRDSWDGNSATYISVANYRKDPAKVYNNAFWNGSKVIYGEVLANSIDVTAHEWTHAINGQTANSQYKGESGAIDEGLADTFATFVQSYTGVNNWTLGEDIGMIKTDLENPNNYGLPDDVNDPQFVQINPPCKKDNDHCGVHTNVGVIGKAAQLLVDGGVHNDIIVPQLGILKTEKLLYHVLSEKLISTSGFDDMRNEAVEAAKKGFTTSYGIEYTFTKKERASVINAFASVGIGEEDSNYDGFPDDQKDPGIGFVSIDIQTSTDSMKTSLCGDPNQVDIYALVNSYGDEELDYAYVKYRINDGEWKSDQTFTKGPWADGGELKDEDWYKFTIKDLTEGGNLTYELWFVGDNTGAVFKDNPVINVETCQDQVNANNLFQIIAKNEDISGPQNIPMVDISTFEVKNLDLGANGTISGYVSSGGQTGGDPIAGEPYSGSKAFLSYDIASFAYGAVSKQLISAKLNVSGAQETGDPFSLGVLKIYDCLYDTLDASDYNKRCTLITNISTIRSGFVDVTDYVKNAINSSKTKFQLRLEFESTNNGNRTTDKILFPVNSTPLKIEYQ